MNWNKVKINKDSSEVKYQLVVNAINDSIANNILKVGERIPSVNDFSKEYKFSRDTVFKAFTILKNNGVIESIPNKGYFVSSNIKRVLLVLNTFKEYKQVIYNALIENLPKNFIVDLQFHHYSLENFKTIINNSKGKYYKYLVMNMDHVEVPEILSSINNDQLLLIDLNVQFSEHQNYIFQDFGQSFYDCLAKGVPLFKKYKQLVYVYPSYTYHPRESVVFFEKFCADFSFSYKIITDPKQFNVQKGNAYISVSERILSTFLKQCREKQYELGEEVGYLSYNETPMKEFINKGISVISTDFEELGKKAAEFIVNDNPVQLIIPTSLIIRTSL
ncbi:GntR family transcriptional regulator [Tamlana fucoidanivorans]|uniref:GntR family transcriptional regulator n=1 Tax=Allotamlana fucoidanivorans TaxID=2583814 RepID=A0A5C4SQU3_9FLAO|nr:GntR family transcriptional regulator [Tamlana fucoidanivorans]TNJ46635.1 GntR family transcriptional regulator [Tamlana fucoidanivorans]